MDWEKALNAKTMNNIKNINENEYEILETNTQIYEMQIKQGYTKDRINQY